MEEETVVLIVGLLAFLLGFLVRGEIQRFRQRKQVQNSRETKQ
jgi:hypothetical protein